MQSLIPKSGLKMAKISTKSTMIHGLSVWGKAELAKVVEFVNVVRIFDNFAVPPVCRKSMDSVDIVQLEYWNKNPWTMSTESMDNVH